MSNQHPLTDDTIRYTKKLGCHDLGTWIYTENDMRAAADWQLEQVMEWLDKSLTDYSDTEVWNCIDNLHWLRSDLKKAMRPTTQEDS